MKTAVSRRTRSARSSHEVQGNVEGEVDLDPQVSRNTGREDDLIVKIHFLISLALISVPKQT